MTEWRCIRCGSTLVSHIDIPGSYLPGGQWCDVVFEDYARICEEIRKQKAAGDGGAPDLWLVFKWADDGQAEFMGVFNKMERAVDVCRSERYCVCPARLNELMPEEREPCWPGAWFPKQRQAGGDAGAPSAAP